MPQSNVTVLRNYRIMVLTSMDVVPVIQKAQSCILSTRICLSGTYTENKVIVESKFTPTVNVEMLVSRKIVTFHSVKLSIL